MAAAARTAPREERLPTTEAVEDYAKAIFSLGARTGGSVGTTALAERLDVSTASVSAMVKRLAELGLVEHKRYRGVVLTAAGEKVALEVIRHHRLLETYLAEALGMPWDRVHAEAEVLEHHISETLEELIADRLGHPSTDPHGDPIPDRDLNMPADDTRALPELEPGEGGVFARISDRDPEMLRYLDGRGIVPGAPLEVIDKQPFDGPISIRLGDRVETVGGRLAAAMRVAPPARG